MYAFLNSYLNLYAKYQNFKCIYINQSFAEYQSKASTVRTMTSSRHFIFYSRVKAMSQSSHWLRKDKMSAPISWLFFNHSI